MPQVNRHPEKRRVPIVCGLCDLNETTAGNGVCGTCQESYRIGTEAQRIRSISAIEGYFLPIHTYSLDTRDRDDYGVYTRVSFGELIERLTGRVADRGFHSHRSNDMILKESNSYRKEYYKYFLTEEQAKVIKDFLAALDLKLEKIEKDAYRAGSNMISRLASGELSIDDVNKMAIKREGGE